MTQRPYSYYNAQGEILMTAQCAACAVKAAIDAGLYAGAVGGLYDTNEVYVVDGKVTPRPTMATSIEPPKTGLGGLLSTVLKGVPAGATIEINGKDYKADGSPVELSFALLGPKVITVRKWPAKPWTVTL